MERSGPDDARDDAWEFDDESDPIYPAAPVPPHERTWRHPSEMGQAAWVRSEPPVHIGRGLLVTSGAIGSALGVAVLYLLAPTGGGTPHAGPTATSSIVTVRSTIVAEAGEAELTSPRDVTSTSQLWIDSPGLTLPPIDVPSTVLVMSNAVQDDPDVHPVSVAVAIEGASYVVTTANALSSIDTSNDGVALMGPGAPDEVSPLSAELLSIDGDLAYLEPSASIEVVSFAATAAAAPGQPVTVLSDTPTEVAYAPGDVATELDASTIVEGTPVIDDSGALVALCTVVIDGEGARVEFVPITGEVPATTDDTTDTSVPTDDTVAGDATTTTAVTGATTGTGGATSTTVAPTAWIGLSFDSASSTSPLTIAKVAAGSPAMTAGVMVGERLVAVDGTPVTTVDDVVNALRRHTPGDVVKLTLAARAGVTITTTTTSTTVASSSTSTTTASTSTTTTSTTVPATGNTGNTAGTAGSGTSGSSPGSPTATPATRVVSVVLAAASPSV
ncbi:MAG: PDZ domain-containing protein [Acidimicrobiales bacterium]